MATSTWLGGYGLFDPPENWDPDSVPGAGDTATIGSGGALVLFESIPATVVLGSTDPGAQPALGLLDASVGTLTMPHDLPQPPYATDASPTQYGTVLVAGQGSIGTIDLGAFADQDRFSNPGHGPLFAPDNLTVRLPGPSTLAAGFHVRDGSTLTVQGGDGSALDATDSIMEGGRAVISTTLGGDARIVLAGGATNGPPFETAGGSLELGGGVGAGDTIDIRIGTLQIGQPMQFQGHVDMLGDQGSPGRSYIFGPRSVELAGLAADAFGFDDASHTLTLFQGGAAVDQLRFTPDVTAASFSPTGEYANQRIWLAQTDAGVLLREGIPTGPIDATPIPLLSAQA